MENKKPNYAARRVGAVAASALGAGAAGAAMLPGTGAPLTFGIWGGAAAIGGLVKMADYAKTKKNPNLGRQFDNQ